ncbi:MAG: class I SAM-dependent methyltransferase [Syntrophales bacterium]|nr:class I SAM-dependent methyltransferase [Syntrophales bacterium]
MKPPSPHPEAKDLAAGERPRPPGVPAERTAAAQFDFGKNWQLFSEHALTPEKVRQARRDFARLLQGIDLKGKSFLDIGFGQGLSLLIATAMDARTVGCDINPTCGEVLEANKRLFFPEVAAAPVPVIIGSILADAVLADLRRASPEGTGLYDLVHSWGVLHHTGNMELALKNAASLVKPGGYLILALYNRHWTSPLWLGIKYLYHKSPPLLRQGMIHLFYPLIYLAKLVITGENPRKQTRGMDFYYNVVDWVGGYPYEYAPREEIIARLQPLGLEIQRFIPAQVPTGCNEFIFRKD